MENILELLKKNDTLCEIYTNEENLNKFSVGYIVAIDKNFFVFENIDEYGFSDGIFSELKENIIKFETDTHYLKEIEKLFEYNKQKRYKSLNIECFNITAELIKHALSLNYLCSFNLCNSKEDEIIGFVDSIQKNYVKIKNIDLSGKENGYSIIEYGNITGTTFGSLGLKKIEKLKIINSSKQ